MSNKIIWTHQLQLGVLTLGPGRRVVIWCSGCNINCPHCCSPESHARDRGTQLTVKQVMDVFVAYVADGHVIDGLTISGGEATEQSDSILELIYSFKQLLPNADVLLYSGLSSRELHRNFAPLVRDCDVVISEPYVHKLQSESSSTLIGSTNQKIELLTSRAQERYPSYLARPQKIHIHKFVNHTNKKEKEENKQKLAISFTGVPNAPITKGKYHV